MKGYTFFWGCQIPARFSFMEKSTRLVLDTLNVDYVDLPGFTCCPEKTLVKNYNEKLWMITAARNIAIAEKNGRGMLHACTGCYSTLQSVNSKIKAYPKIMDEVNGFLGSVGLMVSGRCEIKHIVEFFHDELGYGKIREKVKRPLKGMRIAVHGGCHLVRPSRAIHFDDPVKPVKYDRLIEWIGARSVYYSTKMMCCGGYLDRTGQHSKTLYMASVKLHELSIIKVDAITTTCPECFKVYDNYQYLLKKEHPEFNIPVFTLQELMALSFGFSPDELGLDQHKMNISQFVEKWRRGF